ncbi:NUDIX domain-containing protein [Epibacterium sp. SM1969]|uniref:NUDIX domain-containing protein n=1 Tax=Tritonibacter aquimaris TaxID=2663379 RepID=A0A844AQX4_9RHOB|nr:NUDIX hydrolase [Tritonibacter aquimaris]MQY43343.1 NUDIX domain-containing protein [Tritonibacter aquimaris]
MTSFFPTKVWEEYLRPLILRPRRLQVAALCLRGSGDNRKVLLITSRDTGRWIIPKGWPMNGKTCSEAALQEAWEEAGVIEAEIDDTPIGSYNYYKRRDNGTREPVTTLIYAVNVHKLADSYPEASQRKRKWLSPKKASTLVAEPELQELLAAL